jgi:hypothetical protein
MADLRSQRIEITGMHERGVQAIVQHGGAGTSSSSPFQPPLVSPSLLDNCVRRRIPRTCEPEDDAGRNISSKSSSPCSTEPPPSTISRHAAKASPVVEKSATVSKIAHARRRHCSDQDQQMMARVQSFLLRRTDISWTCVAIGTVLKFKKL